MPFIGRATDQAGVFLESPEDVSPIVSIISPVETPYLDLVGDATFAATRPLHEFLEDRLAPNAVLTAVALASLAPGDSQAIGISGGRGLEIKLGAILECQDTFEQVRVTAVSASTITVTRGFAGTSAPSFGSGVWFEVIGNAQLEGRDATQDTSRARDRLHNYVQLFMADIIISGTEVAQANIGVGDEFDYQTQKVTKTLLLDLERACIRSRLSGNSIGGANAVRTMEGLLQRLSTNNFSYGSYTSIGDFETKVNGMLRAAWRQGGTDLSHIMCDAATKEVYDQLNASRIRTMNQENVFSNRVTVYENTYGIFPVHLNRWFPRGRQASIAKSRIAVAALQKRSFHREMVGKTGDSEKAFVVGEYTQEVRNEAGMAQMHIGGFTTSPTP